MLVLVPNNLHGSNFLYRIFGMPVSQFFHTFMMTNCDHHHFIGPLTTTPCVVGEGVHNVASGQRLMKSLSGGTLSRQKWFWPTLKSVEAQG